MNDFETLDLKIKQNFRDLFGEELMLNDVLRYIGKVDLELDRNILWINKSYLWDLRIPLLKNQSEELHYNLLNKLLKN